MSNTGLYLGTQPEPLWVLLPDGGDFLCVLELDEPWPVGTTVSLVFGNGVTWAATISGTEATFSKTAALSSSSVVPDGTPVRLVVTGATVQVWAVGSVIRYA